MAIEKEQPIESVLREIMNDIGAAIGRTLKDATAGTGERYGFALLMFGLSGNEYMRMNYLANVNREDMLVAMKEFIARAEGRYQESSPPRV
jgi:hypothetical protein